MTSDSEAVTTEDPTAAPVLADEAPEPGADLAADGGPGARPESGTRTVHGRRRPRALTIVSVLAVALFALWGIGTPLLGNGSLTTTDKMMQFSPYAEAGHAGGTTSNMYLDDTFTSEFPSYILYKQALSHSLTGGQWDPYMSGGVPLASTPNYAMASPLSIPYYLLPTWLAPAYERLLEIIVAVGGCFLFLRRLRISRPAAITAGMVYAGSAFMVVWLNFPQTRVAAIIPALFWAIERHLQLRRPRDAAFIALPVASLLLGGFPSVAGYGLLTAVAYAVVRIAADHRSRPRQVWRTAAGAGLGLVAGVGLTAFQMLPFYGFLSSWYTTTRAQDSTQHIDVTSLLTAIAPWSFGTADPARLPLFYLGFNFVEFVGYAGAAAVVLVLVAFALRRTGTALLPRGVWVFFTAAVLVWGELIYVGGWPLGLLQRAPGLSSLFAMNYIGRARSVLGFLLAVLAGIGFELLLRHRVRRRGAARSRVSTGWAVGVGMTAAAFTGLLLWWGGRRAAAQQAQLRRQNDQTAVVGLFWHEILIAGLLVLAAIACVLVLRAAGRRANEPHYGRVWRKARFAAAAALPLLIAGQSTSFVSLYYPNSPVSTFYPVTDTHSYLAANLGGERFASSQTGMIFGTNVAYDLRSVNGHAFINDNFTTLVKAVPGDSVPYGTYIDFAASDATAGSPILDLLGTKYFVTEINDPVLGTQSDDRGDGSRLTLRPGRSLTAPLPVTGPVRGVGIVIEDPVPAALTAPDSNSWIEVSVRDASGARIADTRRLTDTIDTTTAFTLPVTADSVPAGTPLTATFTLHAAAPLTIAAVNATAPALVTVVGGDDGLRLVHVGSNAIYQRLNAQPRIRWASTSTVVSSRYQRMQLLSSGQVGADRVVLSEQHPAASGRPATVHVDEDGLDTISTTVKAQGAGYLVVADADQVGWRATVDGKAAHLLAADEGVVAVAVPTGTHTVSLHFWPPHGTIAYPLTGATVVGLVAVVLGDMWWARRRRRRAAEPTAAG